MQISEPVYQVYISQTIEHFDNDDIDINFQKSYLSRDLYNYKIRTL